IRIQRMMDQNDNFRLVKPYLYLLEHTLLYQNNLYLHLTFQQRYQMLDRKSTRLNSSHVSISYAVFCLKKKKNNTRPNKIPRATAPVEAGRVNTTEATTAREARA